MGWELGRIEAQLSRKGSTLEESALSLSVGYPICSYVSRMQCLAISMRQQTTSRSPLLLKTQSSQPKLLRPRCLAALTDKAALQRRRCYLAG